MVIALCGMLLGISSCQRFGLSGIFGGILIGIGDSALIAEVVWRCGNEEGSLESFAAS